MDHDADYIRDWIDGLWRDPDTRLSPNEYDRLMARLDAIDAKLKQLVELANVVY